MQPLDTQLIVFSSIFCIVLAAAIVIPILFFKRDWLTAWNIFLLGSFIFTGLSGINAATNLYYGTYSQSTYMKFYVGVIVFYGTIFCVYHLFRWPRRFAGCHFLKWPTPSVYALFILILLLTAFSAIRLFIPNIPFVGQLLAQFSLQTPTVAAALAFVAWYRNRANPLLLSLLIGTLLLALFFGIMAGSGRRYLISVLILPVVCCYWMTLRYRSNTFNILALLCLVSAVAPVYLGYNALRHYHRRAIKLEGMTATERALEIMRMLPSTFSQDVQFSEKSLNSFMGQDSVETALVTIEFLNDGSQRLEVRPLFALYFLAVNSIPRSVWPDKPVSMGHSLVSALGRAGPQSEGNYGVNVVGQGYYDGGLAVHVLYALLFGVFLRIVDELMKRQPDNPFILAFFICSAVQILAWPRGQIDTITTQIISPFMVILLTAYVGRLLFGTGYVAPQTSQIDQYPDRFTLPRLRQIQFQ